MLSALEAPITDCTEPDVIDVNYLPYPVNGAVDAYEASVTSSST